jgi:hypothetical protein
MSDTTTSLDTHSLLLDARLRVLNRERVTPEDMRRILLSIAHDRENAARAGARNRAAAKKAVAAPTLDIDTLFGTPSHE